MDAGFVEHVKRPRTRAVLLLVRKDGTKLERTIEPDGTIKDRAVA